MTISKLLLRFFSGSPRSPNLESHDAKRADRTDRTNKVDSKIERRSRPRTEADDYDYYHRESNLRRAYSSAPNTNPYLQDSERATMPQISQHARKVDIPPQKQTERLTGSIRKLLATYGFIAGDDGVDYFLHWSGMDRRSIDFRRLAIQQRVSFEVVNGDRGLRAVSVIVTDIDD